MAETTEASEPSNPDGPASEEVEPQATGQEEQEAPSLHVQCRDFNKMACVKVEQWLAEHCGVPLQKVFKLKTWSYAFVTVLPEHKEKFRENVEGLLMHKCSVSVSEGTPRKSRPKSDEQPSAKRQKVKDFPPGHIPTLKDLQGKLKNKDPGDILHKSAPLIDWSYETQLSMKGTHIKTAVRSFTKQVDKKCKDLSLTAPAWTSFEWSKASGAPLLGYRNKCEFSIGKSDAGEIECGFVRRITDDGYGRIVASCDDVPLVSMAMKKLCKAMRDCVRGSKFEIFERGKGWQKGYWRMVMVRQSTADELLVMVQTATLDEDQTQRLSADLITALTQAEVKVVSIYLQFNNEVSDAARPGAPLKLIHGSAQLRMELLGLSFHIGPLSFYQANSSTCALLYQRALEWLRPEKDVAVLDVCCGVGTIGLCASRCCRKVIGIELIPEAVESAKANAALNKVDNTEWVVGKAEDVLPEVLQGLDPSLEVCAIVDPPRPGLHTSVLRALRACSQLSRIVYVSCNPDSLVEDVVKLTMPSESDADPFVPLRAVAVDMFPHTLHCEMILLLERNSKVKDPRKAVQQTGPVLLHSG